MDFKSISLDQLSPRPFPPTVVAGTSSSNKKKKEHIQFFKTNSLPDIDDGNLLVKSSLDQNDIHQDIETNGHEDSATHKDRYVDCFGDRDFEFYDNGDGEMPNWAIFEDDVDGSMESHL